MERKEWILSLEKTIQRNSARFVKFAVGRGGGPSKTFSTASP